MGTKQKVAIGLMIAAFVAFVVVIYLPLIVPHTGFKLVDGLGMRFEPVKHPYTGEKLATVFVYKGGYTYQHWYTYKGYPDSGMMREGGFKIDGSVMRQFITTAGVSGPLVFEIWVDYTLPNHQMACSFGNRGNLSLSCFDLQQQQTLFQVP